jgi:hypothetical protein
LLKPTIILVLILLTTAPLNGGDPSLLSPMGSQWYPALPASAPLAAQNVPGRGDPNNSGNSSGLPIVETGSYSWQQNPGGTSGLLPGFNTVTLTPCPHGVNGSDKWHYLYISGTGTPEAVLITGGSCVSGAPSGMVQFTAANIHPLGYTIASATGGIQESINAAVMPSPGLVSRNVLITPGDYTLYARLSIRASGLDVTASGSTITCLMRDTCIMVGDPSNANMFNEIKLHGLRIRPGVVDGTFPAVEDNAQGSRLEDIGPASPVSAGATFGHLVQIDNDQAALIDGLNPNTGAWARCDTSFCSSAVYAPGPFSTNAGVLWIKHSPMNLQCRANGIENEDANTLHIEDSVIEAYAQFGIRSHAMFGNTPAAQLSNVYQEVGNCRNPLRTGIAGLIVEGGYATKIGGIGPAGALPVYAKTGANQYNYYVVVHSSTMGISPPFLAGYALTNGVGGIPVVWNQVGSAGIITYDVLRVIGNLGADTKPPFGTGNFAIATGVTTASCSKKVCSIIDKAGSTPLPYTVALSPAYSPALLLWPGSVILTTGADRQNTGGLVPTRYFTDDLEGGGIVNSAGATQPSVFAQQCSPLGQWSPLWISCEAGNSLSNDFPPVVGTLYQLSNLGGSKGRLKGRLIFELPPESSISPTHIITLLDSNPLKTLNTPMHRPSSDPGDMFIGLDNSGGYSPGTASKTQLSIGAAGSISNYINNVGDGTNWLERLTANLKAFRVPVSATAFQTGSNCVSALGSCGSAPAGRVTIAAGATTVTVFTATVTPNSEISVGENVTYGQSLGVVCNKDWGRHYRIIQQVAGSFTIESDEAPTNTPACLSFSVLN